MRFPRFVLLVLGFLLIGMIGVSATLECASTKRQSPRMRDGCSPSRSVTFGVLNSSERVSPYPKPRAVRP